MILSAQSVPSARVGAVRRVAPGRLGARRRRRSTTSAARFWLDSDVGRRPRGRGDAAAARPSARSTARPRCRATRSGCAATSGSSGLPPDLRSTRTYRVPGRLRHLRVRVRRRADRLAPRRRRQRAGVPAPSALVAEVRRSRRPRAVRRGAPRARADRDARSRCSLPRRVVLRVVVVLVVAIVATALSLRLLGIRRGWGTALHRRRRSGGRPRCCWRPGSTTGTGAPTGSCCTRSRSAIPATMAVAVTLDLLARPGSLAIGERAGLVVAPRPVRAVKTRIAVLRRYRELVRLARREGFGPFLSAAGRGGALGGSGRACGSGACSRRPAGST